MDHRSTLHGISSSLGDDDLNALKFLLKDHLYKTELSEITKGFELFTVLSQKKLTTTTDQSLLKEILLKIGRHDLASELRECAPNKLVSPFRFLLYDIAADLHQTNLSDLIYLFNISKHKKHLIKNAFDLLSHLEELGMYSEHDTGRLQDCLKHMSRTDLANKLKEFHAGGADRSSKGVGRGPPVQESNTSNTGDDSPVQEIHLPLQETSTLQKTETATETADMGDVDVNTPIPNPGASRLSSMFEGALGKSTPDKEKLIDIEPLLTAGQSVGLIGRNGTGFVVGGGHVMTTAHVFKDALGIPEEDMGKCKNSTDYLRCVQKRLNYQSLHIRFSFRSQQQTFRLRRVVFMDIEIDASVVETENCNSSILPPPLTRFLDVPDCQISFELLGHDDAEPDISRDRKCYTVVDKSDFQKMKEGLRSLNVPEECLRVYDKFGKNPNFVEFHCSMKQGASGSPGVVVDNGEVWVFAMLRAGFPELPVGMSVHQELCVEQGVRMTALKSRLDAFDPQLSEQIFPFMLKELGVPCRGTLTKGKDFRPYPPPNFQTPSEQINL